LQSKNNPFGKIKTFILDLLFPLKCAGCGKLDFCLCPGCFAKIVLVKSPTCPNCQTLTKKGQFCQRCYSKIKPHLNGLVTAAYFREGPLKKAIHQFKYEFVRDFSVPLGAFLASSIKERDFSDFLVIPIPLSRKRFLWRGFNQAELLAKEVCQKNGLKLNGQILRRIKNTTPQIELSREERRENILGAFRANDLQGGQKILLVDDVYTTGATLNECARVLKEAGADKVWGLVVAKD